MQEKILLKVRKDVLNIYVTSDKAVKDSYANYRLLHIVKPYNDGGIMQNQNLWRLYELFGVEIKDGNVRNNPPYCIMNAGEWECAIAIAGTPDFHGGFHGYEHLTSVTLKADGKELDINEDADLWVDSVEFSQTSQMYKQGTKNEVVADHIKHYLFKDGGLTISQGVLWAQSLDVRFAYLSMLPFRRTHNNAPDGEQISDHLQVAGDPNVYDITNVGHDTPYSPPARPLGDVRKLKVWGEKSGFAAEVTIDGNFTDSATVMVQNNLNYNKVYFSFAGGGKPYITEKGESWKIRTVYEIYKEK